MKTFLIFFVIMSVLSWIWFALEYTGYTAEIKRGNVFCTYSATPFKTAIVFTVASIAIYFGN